ELQQRVLAVRLWTQGPKDHRTMNNKAAIVAEEGADGAVRWMAPQVRVLKLKPPITKAAVWRPVRMKGADQRFDEAWEIADRALEQARREFGSDDLTTMIYLDLRVAVLRRLGDLERARTGAAEVLAVRERKLPPENPQVRRALASLADIRRHQGATDEAKTLFARLHDAAQRALDSLNKQTNPSLHLDLGGEIKWAEYLARNLGRPGRSGRSELP